MSNVFKQSPETQRVFKYRLGSKWYSFNTDLLTPEDKLIFDNSKWPDKLNMINIYSRINKHNEDNFSILGTKKEDANKDKRKQEYRDKREKINNKITELNNQKQKIIEEHPEITENEIIELNNKT